MGRTTYLSLSLKTNHGIHFLCQLEVMSSSFVKEPINHSFIHCVGLCSQDHYDWGLRAIKSVLVVAGSLKRSDTARPEDQVTTAASL